MMISATGTSISRPRAQQYPALAKILQQINIFIAIAANTKSMTNMTNTGTKPGAISGRECARSTQTIFFPFNELDSFSYAILGLRLTCSATT